MAVASVAFEMDEDLKTNMEQVCNDMGMNMPTVFSIIAARVVKDRRIPFDVDADADPFYSEANMAELRRRIADIESGRTKLTQHELIEVDDDE